MNEKDLKGYVKELPVFWNELSVELSLNAGIRATARLYKITEVAIEKTGLKVEFKFKDLVESAFQFLIGNNQVELIIGLNNYGVHLIDEGDFWASVLQLSSQSFFDFCTRLKNSDHSQVFTSFFTNLDLIDLFIDEKNEEEDKDHLTLIKLKENLLEREINRQKSDLYFLQNSQGFLKDELENRFKKYLDLYIFKVE